MAVKKETPEERAERMMAQSQALKERTDWARICEAIKNKPEHLAYCKKYLLSVGAWSTGPTATALKQAEARRGPREAEDAPRVHVPRGVGARKSTSSNLAYVHVC